MDKGANNDGSSNGAGVHSDIHSGDDSRSNSHVLGNTNDQDTKVADDKTVVLKPSNGHKPIDQQKTERIA